MKIITKKVVSYSKIPQCCNNRQKTAGGFIWSYNKKQINE